MINMQTLKLQVILKHELTVRDRTFERKLADLRTELNNPIRFWSGERIVLGFQLISAAIHDFGDFAIDQCERVECGPAHYAVASDAIEKFWENLTGWVPIFV